MTLQATRFGMIAVSWLAWASIAAATEGDRAAPAQNTLKAVVDFSKSLGKIRALNGVCNGPLRVGGHTTDMATLHAEAGFPSVRLHDCHWPNPNVVDIPCIFPLFHADPDDPRNYVFAPTDHYLEPIVKNRCQIVYRLGVSIEHLTRFYVHPPEDFQKWAKICVNVIRHYNDGWANGFHYNIKYFEIWNEPNIGLLMWSGTREQYYDLYRVAATALKAYDPSLKVGGPVTSQADEGTIRSFLAYCRDRELPVDFLSWHCYDSSPRAIIRSAVTARALLDEYGFRKAESYCTEWRPMIASFDALSWKKDLPATAVREAFARNRNHEAAAFAASVLMLVQDSPIDMAHFYTADDSPWSMFDEFGVPGKAFFAFKAFNQLLQTPNRVAAEGATDGDGVMLCAGEANDRKTAAFLLSNFRGKQSQVAITIKNLPMTGKVRVERYLVDQKYDFECIGDEESLNSANPVLHIALPPASVCLVRLSQK